MMSQQHDKLHPRKSLRSLWPVSYPLKLVPLHVNFKVGCGSGKCINKQYLGDLLRTFANKHCEMVNVVTAISRFRRRDGENSERYGPSEGGKTFRVSEVEVECERGGDKLGNSLSCLNRKRLPLAYISIVKFH